ncbi:MAG TPA: hypothetical protein VJQ08_02585 [Candidatus Dormibacteraeota bacterium]|nr:hypothetical protein [Candidatus Dormibacteraeota bacterium]
MQATISIRRLNFVSALLVAVVLALGATLGAAGALLVTGQPHTIIQVEQQGQHSPLPAECKRFGGPTC